MIFGQDRTELRAMYIAAWQKSLAGRPLSALEAQIVAVIERHPEYHKALAPLAIDTDFDADSDTNPFLHMGLHLAVRDQIAIDSPSGIRDEFERLRRHSGDEHHAEHRLIDCLAEALSEAQRTGSAPDQHAYMERVRLLEPSS